MRTVRNYNILKYPVSFFDYFIEIGGEKGAISRFMCERDPDLKVICYEPCRANFKRIHKRLKNHPNAIYVQKALGTGEPLFFHSQTNSYTHMFSSESNDSYSVESVRLGDIIIEHNVDIYKPFEMVIDCEGGEWSMVGDTQAENILKKCTHLGMEVHFHKDDAQSDRFDHLGRWEDIDKWIRGVFLPTHDISHSREGRRIGIRTYVISKKD